MTVTSPSISNGCVLWHPTDIRFIYNLHSMPLSFMGQNINFKKKKRRKAREERFGLVFSQLDSLFFYGVNSKRGSRGVCSLKAHYCLISALKLRGRCVGRGKVRDFFFLRSEHTVSLEKGVYIYTWQDQAACRDLAGSNWTLGELIKPLRCWR